MIKYLHNMGLRSEHAYAAGFGSIALTVINWAGSKLMHSGDKADRNGLFTGQWADLPFEEVARLASEWGYDGLEIACWGDHLDVERAATDDGRSKHAVPWPHVQALRWTRCPRYVRAVRPHPVCCDRPSAG